MKGKQFLPEAKNLFLKPEEVKVISLAMSGLLTDLQVSFDDIMNEESIKTKKEILAVANKLTVKLNKLGFNIEVLPDVSDDEVKDYLK